MSTQTLYCHRCKTEYQVRHEDLQLMQKHYGEFNPQEYRGGCFFKNLGALKRSINKGDMDDHRCTGE
jgi:hypothetical protein